MSDTSGNCDAFSLSKRVIVSTPVQSAKQTRRMRSAMLLASVVTLASVTLLVHLRGVKAYIPNSYHQHHHNSATISESKRDSRSIMITSPMGAFQQLQADASSSSSSSSSQLTMSSPLMSDHTTPDEFELHVGRALDVLRKDYPSILTDYPNYSIYSDNIEFCDPAQVKLHGLRKYRAAFDVLHAVVKFFYCPSKSSLTFRLCHDKARNNIRVHWNAILVPREIFGGSRTIAHVDGISVYELDAATGQIDQHRIEQLLYNDSPVQPKEGVVALLTLQRPPAGVVIPSFIQQTDANTIFEFTSLPSNRNPLAAAQKSNQPNSLFAMEAEQQQPDDIHQQHDGVDLAALELKNKSRKKFGLKPLSPTEFLELQVAVQELTETRQEQHTAAAAAKAAATKNQAQQKSQPSILDKWLGGVLTETCESNWDCERPQICCDFGFQKRCCSSGSPVGLQYARIPVYAGSVYPPGSGPQDDPRNY